MSGAFTSKGLDSPRLCAEMLLAHVLGCDRLKLYTDPDRPAAEQERAALRDLTQRALNHEPVQYLTGVAWFFSMRFKADARALIPRPCTELIVEHVLQHARLVPPSSEAGASSGPVIADVCTGGGCIAVALAKHLKSARVIACDVSAEALTLARENAELHRVADRLDFLQGDLLAPVLDHPVGSRLNYLVSNPPYIPDDEWNDPEMMGKNVKGHEPELALRAGPDALRLVRPLIAQGPQRLLPGGLLMIELATQSAAAALALAQENPLLDSPRILKDHEGLDRVLLARRR